MANAYTQIYIHLVFAVKYRQSLIDASWEERLYLYIIAVIQNKGHTVIAINAMPDHIHIFFGMKPQFALSDLVREIKKASTAFINQSGLVKRKFQWQSGYGAFSVNSDGINPVASYIKDQKQRHANKTFRKEYQEFLLTYDITYDEKYLFDFLDGN